MTVLPLGWIIGMVHLQCVPMRTPPWGLQLGKRLLHCAVLLFCYCTDAVMNAMSALYHVRQRAHSLVVQWCSTYPQWLGQSPSCKICRQHEPVLIFHLPGRYMWRWCVLSAAGWDRLIFGLSTTVDSDLLLGALVWHALLAHHILKDCFAQCMDLAAFGATPGLSYSLVPILLGRC